MGIGIRCFIFINKHFIIILGIVVNDPLGTAKYHSVHNQSKIPSAYYLWFRTRCSLQHLWPAAYSSLQTAVRSLIGARDFYGPG